MPVERWTPERRRELTRGALIAAAAEVFARRGFEGASLEEIADTAGFTRGAIYKNFGSKEELFFAVSERDFADRLRSFSDALEHHHDEVLDPSVLAGLWQRSLAGNAHNLALNMEVRLFAMRNPDLAARLAEHQRASRQTLAEFISDRAERGSGFALTMPAIALAGILDAASWGFSESIAIDPDDGALLESFFDLIIKSVCTESPHASAASAARMPTRGPRPRRAGGPPA